MAEQLTDEGGEETGVPRETPDGELLLLLIVSYMFQLFVDKDTIMNAVSTSHDAHLLKIDNKEDDIVTRINNWLKAMIEGIHEEQEIKRNRSRVTEINHLIDNLREEIDHLEIAGGHTFWTSLVKNNRKDLPLTVMS